MKYRSDLTTDEKTVLNALDDIVKHGYPQCSHRFVEYMVNHGMVEFDNEGRFVLNKKESEKFRSFCMENEDEKH